VIYHAECRAELSRCVTIGCAGESAAPGQRRAHRDVACVRCERLINNDGDMCFRCWSPLHRRCLAAGCRCAPRPIRATPQMLLQWVLKASIMLGAAILIGSMFGGFVQTERNQNSPDLEHLIAMGRSVGALVGLGVGIVGLIVTALAGPAPPPGQPSIFRGHSRP
jgi:hypothetical protein